MLLHVGDIELAIVAHSQAHLVVHNDERNIGRGNGRHFGMEGERKEWKDWKEGMGGACDTPVSSGAKRAFNFFQLRLWHRWRPKKK
jgi:hypothetical protein